MTTTVQASKKLLRKQLTARLRAVPQSAITEESNTVTAWVINSPWYIHALNISIYLSTPSSEIQTDPLILHSLSSGKRVFIPFCPLLDPALMRMLRLRSVDQFQQLPLNRWGIREMEAKEAERAEEAEDVNGEGLDLILVPGLAFDSTGQRLGHGRGYYDRYIQATHTYPAVFNKPPPKTVALALNEQLLPTGELVPTEEWDKRPDVIVLPRGPLAGR